MRPAAARRSAFHAYLAAWLTVPLALAPASDAGGSRQPAPPATYIVGADISWVQAAEDRGVRYRDKGVEKGVLEILGDHGFNYIRLRVFNDPTKPTPRDRPYSPQGYCDLPHTIAMAKRVKQAGMRLLIDFHYSDSWADPGKQFTPAAWADLSFDDLVKTMHDWTRDAVAAMKTAGVPPDMVQIGNEITPGLMTDRGGSARNWPQLARLLKAGISGVKAVDPAIRVMLHIDRGGDNTSARRWVDAALEQGLAFDVLGLSCYERWHGPPAGWKQNFEDLAGRYPSLALVIAEVDAHTREANEIMRGLPDGRGLGTFIWEPTANNAGQALFDAQGNVIETKMAAYDEVIETYGLRKR
jgi:arabinogalactan endo-1,4-beta-galactosidase